MELTQIKKLLNDNYKEVFSKLNMHCEYFDDNVYCKCPVHENSDNPRAFSYCVKRGIWKCWTRDCQEHFRNDIFGVIRGVLSNATGEEVDFKKALKWVYQNFSIKSGKNNSIKQEPDEDEFNKILRTIKNKNKIIEHPPIQLEDFQVPSEYFLGRGFKKSTLKFFGVGDCNTKGVLYDRAIIPILSDSGKEVIGAIARSTKEYKIPKFLIYPKGFDKRYCFYNYFNAKKRAEETSCLYVLEGQGDVWRMHEAGVKNAIGLLGKTISVQQEQKLKKLAVTHLIIILDNDQAGREARIKIQRQLGRTYKLTFPKLQDKDIGDMSVKKIKDDILTQLRGTY